MSHSEGKDAKDAVGTSFLAASLMLILLQKALIRAVVVGR